MIGTIGTAIVALTLSCSDLEECHPSDDIGWYQAGYLWSDNTEKPKELADDTLAGYLWSD